ncbi:MAG: hypothetical protein AB1540_11600 [Bdellovibrionota bacterium]
MGLALVATVGCKPSGLFSQSKSSQSSNGTSRVGITIPSAQTSVTRFAATAASSQAPSGLDQFDCFAVNVLGGGIKSQSGCAGMAQVGASAGFVGRGGRLEVDVPMGTGRLVQIWGFAGSESCPDVTKLINLPLGELPPGARSAGFLLAQRTLDILSSKMTIDMTLTYAAGTSPLMCGSVSSPSTFIDYVRLNPGTEVTSLSSGAVTSDTNDLCVGFRSTAQSPVFRCYEDGVEVTCTQGACNTHGSGSGYGVHRITSTVGSHSFRVTATDSTYGNSDPAPPTFTWTRDNTAPTVTLNSVLPGSRCTTIGANLGVNYVNSSRPTAVVALDEGGSVTFRVDGGAFSSCGSNSAAGTFACALSTLTAGTHTIDFRPTDTAGNVGADVSTSVYFETNAPAGSITPSNGWLYGGTLTDAASPQAAIPTLTDGAGEEPDTGSLSCSIDDADFAACPSILDFTSSNRGGRHSVIINGRDFAGNVAPMTTNYVYIDSLLGQTTLGRLNPDGSYLADESGTTTIRENFPLGVGMFSPGQAALDVNSSRLFVADTSNNRVLVYGWNSNTNSVTSRKALAVFGQPNFLSVDSSAIVGANDVTSAGVTYTPMNGPTGVAVSGDSTALFVSDTGNNRVLRFNISAGVSNKSAAAVFGQSDKINTGINANSGLGSHSVGFPVTTGLRAPMGLYYNSTTGSLFVADRDNCRIAVFASATSYVTGDPMSFHLGANGEALMAGRIWDCMNVAPSTDANNLRLPRAVSLDLTNNRMYVADTGFHRIAVWNPIPTASATAITSVIGQANDTTATAGDGTTAPSLSAPAGVAVVTDASNTPRIVATSVIGATANKVKVFDTSGNLVSQWNSSGTAGVGPGRYDNPGQLHFSAAAGRLFLSDIENNRVAIFTTSSIGNDQTMTDVLGHSDFNGNAAAFYAATANSPNEANLNAPSYAVADTVYNRLYVSDTSNNRVLVYRLNPTTLKPSSGFAVNVIGVPVIDSLRSIPMLDASTSATTPPRADSLNAPRGLAVDGAGRLYIADSGNNRVLRFATNTSTISNALQADLVLGQSDFVSTTAGNGMTQMSGPMGVAYDSTNDRLFVTDASNFRVLVFNTITTAVAPVTAASTIGTGAAGTTATQFNVPEGIVYVQTNAIINAGIFVTDRTNHRVNYFDLSGGVDGTSDGCYGHRAASVAAMCTAGAADDGGTLAANGAYALNSPRGVWYSSSDNRLYISDTGNSRVVAYDLGSTANNRPSAGAGFSANHVNFHAVGGTSQTTSYSAAVSATPSALKLPTGIFRLIPTSGSNLLYIVDPTWHRVGVYEIP